MMKHQKKRETKMKNSKKIFAIAGSILAVGIIAALIIIFAARGSVSFSKEQIDKSTPQSYLNGVIKYNLNEGFKDFSGGLDVLKNFDISDFGSKTQMTVIPSDLFYSVINPLAGVDLSCIKSLTLDFNVNRKKTDLGMYYKLGANDVDIVSADIRFKSSSNRLYVNVPEVLTKPMVMKDKSLSIAKMGDVYGIYDSLFEFLKKDFGKYTKNIYKYVDIIFNSESTVQLGKDLNGQACFIGQIDEATLEKFLVVFLEDVKKDKDIKKLVKDFSKTLADWDGTSFSEDDFESGIDEAIASIKQKIETLSGENEITLAYEISIDENDIINSNRLTANDYVTVFSSNIVNGNKNTFDLEFTIPDEGSLAVKGEGITENNLHNGKYVLYFQNDVNDVPVDVFSVVFENFDLAEYKKGGANGSFSITDFNPELDDIFDYFSDMKIVFDYNDYSKTGIAGVNVLIADQDFVKLEIKSVLGKSESINVSEKDALVCDIEEISNVITTNIDYMNLPIISNLTNAGCIDLITQLGAGF